jgi:hypothetical protein
VHRAAQIPGSRTSILQDRIKEQEKRKSHPPDRGDEGGTLKPGVEQAGSSEHAGESEHPRRYHQCGKQISDRQNQDGA